MEKTALIKEILKYTDIKNNGGELSACCPIHGEKTPSFKIRPNGLDFKCLGCGIHGGLPEFKAAIKMNDIKRGCVLEKKRQSQGPHFRSCEFIQFGSDFCAFESGAGNFTTAVIEMENGDIKNVPAEKISFDVFEIKDT